MTDAIKVLAIEDEESIRDILVYALRREGFHVKAAATGEEGMELLERFAPDVLLLDVNLPDADGFDLCRAVSANARIPILLLTARHDLVDKVLGLELGADDYITKPFEIREVIARIKAVLRRRDIERDGGSRPPRLIVLSDKLELDRSGHAVFRDGQPIKLKPKEYELLLLFRDHPNRVFSREEILDRVWEMDYDGDVRTVDVHVQRIRKKLDESLIETVFGVGYKWRGRSRRC
ncbi:response regulator transcription factor [Cohnella cellulosilytica]|uniref:Response regulator transcription factor n=1 Tax=Cohnella cellulosilytica TaxID=986710 RepID=A0ABW2F4S4_9BACL